MKRKLEMDDVRVGMYVTVTKGEMLINMSSSPDGPIVVKKENKMHKGNVLQVLALEFPFIVINRFSSIGESVHSLDLREVEVIQLSLEYIKHLNPDIVIQEDTYLNDVKKEDIEAIGTK